MELSELKQLLESDDGKAPEVKELISSYAALNNETVQHYCDTVPEAKAWLDSIKDKHLQKGLETWKGNHLEEIINDEIKKRFPEKSEQELEVESLKAEISKMKTEKEHEVLTNRAMQLASEKNLPIDLVGFFIGKNEEQTVHNLSILESTFQNAVQKALEKRIKANGYTPPKADSTVVTDLENLSMNDYIKARTRQ